jgi:hypothetical protein
MNSLHERRHPLCDCGACCDGCGHFRPCESGLGRDSAKDDASEHRPTDDDDIWHYIL